MTSRRGIFFNSKSRTSDKLPSLSTEDPGSSSHTDTTNIEATTTVKKKIVLNHTKRSLSKTNYSGPRKIFSTNYKVISFSKILKRSLFFDNFHLGKSNSIRS